MRLTLLEDGLGFDDGGLGAKLDCCELLPDTARPASIHTHANDAIHVHTYKCIYVHVHVESNTQGAVCVSRYMYTSSTMLLVRDRQATANPEPLWRQSSKKAVAKGSTLQL